MVQDTLLKQLLIHTKEEQHILQFETSVERQIYTSKSNFIIESEKFLTEDQLIMMRKHTRFVDFPQHRHDYLEINYAFNGSMQQTINGNDITLQKGELLFLNQHISHSIKASSENDIIINFIVHPKFFEYIISFLNTENKIQNFLISSLYNSTQSGQYLYFQVADIPIIQELLHKIMFEMMHPNLLSNSSIKLYIGLLIIELTKNIQKLVQADSANEQYYLIVESLKYIETNYQHASLQTLAKKLNQPYTTLSRHIKNITSFTFKELVQEKRLSIAKKLLEETDLPITSIALEIGYENFSYFYRLFKKKYSMTPKEFKYSIQK